MQPQTQPGVADYMHALLRVRRAGHAERGAAGQRERALVPGVGLYAGGRRGIDLERRDERS